MEWKTIDVSAADQAIPTAGSMTLLNGVGQGVDLDDRVGRIVDLQQLVLRLFFFPDPTTTAPTGDVLRALVVFDRQSNSATPAVTDVLSAASFASPNNLNNRERFIILSDNFIPTESTEYTMGAVTGGSPKAHVLEIYRDIDTFTTFSGTGADIASIQTGSLFLLLISANASYTCTINSRVRFTDN